jgi:hypothetical protein
VLPLLRLLAERQQRVVPMWPWPPPPPPLLLRCPGPVVARRVIAAPLAADAALADRR